MALVFIRFSDLFASIDSVSYYGADSFPDVRRLPYSSWRMINLPCPVKSNDILIVSENLTTLDSTDDDVMQNTRCVKRANLCMSSW
jgi:hypothetical protein